MEKIQRNERLAMMLKMLTDEPGKVFNLGNFGDMFLAAKSTISEDVELIRDLLARFDAGTIETIAGASGGVRYISLFGKAKVLGFLEDLSMQLSKKERILPGGYVYMLDIIYNPIIIEEIGRIFAGCFYNKEIDCVVTVETKGIPIAFTTAKYLNVPLVIARHKSTATDGPSVNINYITGSSRKIQTMVLPMRNLKRNSNILFIDDFMKAGGTAKGIVELANEFECTISGIGVMIETGEPEKKLVDNYLSLLTLVDADDKENNITICPSKVWYST
jgi:purine operon repressor